MEPLTNRHNGPCIVCMTPTDTALTFSGEAEWCIAGLVTLGVPEEEAMGTFYLDPKEPDADGTHTISYRVCTRCVRACPASFPDPVVTLAGADVPAICQPPTLGRRR